MLDITLCSLKAEKKEVYEITGACEHCLRNPYKYFHSDLNFQSWFNPEIVDGICHNVLLHKEDETMKPKMTGCIKRRTNNAATGKSSSS